MKTSLLKTPDEVLKQKARRYVDRMGSINTRSNKIGSELDSELYEFTSDKNRLKFIKVVEETTIQLYEEHLPKCTHPESCTHNKKFEAILAAVQDRMEAYEPDMVSISSISSNTNFFSENEEFDAKVRIIEIIESANSEIILIDGYVDSKTLDMLKTKEQTVKVKILTSSRSNKPKLDVLGEAFKKQYGEIEIKVSDVFHDRFLILDSKVVYHFGASIKDAGNKVFMYTEIQDAELKSAVLKKFNNEWN